MRDSWVRQLIDVCLSENQRPYFCFLHVRQKIDTIRHDTPQRAHTSNTINDNCINLIRDNWSRVYSLGLFFYIIIVLCFICYYFFFFFKSIYFSDHFIVIWNVMLFNSIFYQLLLFLMLLTAVCQKSSQKLHAIHRLLFGCLLSNDHNNCPHHAYKSSIDDFWDENADSGASSAYLVGFLKTLSTENVGIS